MKCHRAAVIAVCCFLLQMSVMGLMYHTIRVSGTLSCLISQNIAYLILGWLADVHFDSLKSARKIFTWQSHSVVVRNGAKVGLNLLLEFLSTG